MKLEVGAQLDIFGNEISLNEITEISNKSIYGGNISLKSKFRSNHGFKNGYYCKDCKHFKEVFNRNKKYFKCGKIGVSSSIATDIRKSDIACNLYEEES